MPELTIPGEYAAAVGIAIASMGVFIKWLVGKLVSVVENNTRAMADLTAEIQAANRIQRP